jgi:hypothetical protein
VAVPEALLPLVPDAPAFSLLFEPSLLLLPVPLPLLLPLPLPLLLPLPLPLPLVAWGVPADAVK